MHTTYSGDDADNPDRDIFASGQNARSGFNYARHREYATKRPRSVQSPKAGPLIDRGLLCGAHACRAATPSAIGNCPITRCLFRLKLGHCGIDRMKAGSTGAIRHRSQQSFFGHSFRPAPDACIAARRTAAGCARGSRSTTDRPRSGPAGKTADLGRRSPTLGRGRETFGNDFPNQRKTCNEDLDGPAIGTAER